MRLTPTPLADLLIVETFRADDERGAFHRIFDAAVFADAGLEFEVRQTCIGSNTKAATLRGMHYQAAPVRQAKLVHCLRGRLFDVAIDLRRGSPTFCKWFGIELSAEIPRALLIPPGFAHGFVTLCDDTDVLYGLSSGEVPGHARGVRWDDPLFDIRWPCLPQVMNSRDREWPDFDAGRA